MDNLYTTIHEAKEAQKTTIKIHNCYNIVEVQQHKKLAQKKGYYKIKSIDEDISKEKYAQIEDILIQNLMSSIFEDVTPHQFKLFNDPRVVTIEEIITKSERYIADRERAIKRAKAIFREYALNNDWQYWTTFTFSPRNVKDRTNQKEIWQCFANLVKKHNLKHENKWEYLLIPEKHKNGAWHMHGYIKGVMPQELRHYTRKKDNRVYNFTDINQLAYYCGHTVIIPLCGKPDKDRLKIISYTAKYADKSMQSKNLYDRLYYASKGLRKPLKININTAEEKDFYKNLISKDHYENDYIIKNVLTKEEYEDIKQYLDTVV